VMALLRRLGSPECLELVSELDVLCGTSVAADSGPPVSDTEGATTARPVCHMSSKLAATAASAACVVSGNAASVSAGARGRLVDLVLAVVRSSIDNEGLDKESLAQISPDTHLLDAGIDSVMASTIANELQERTGLQLCPTLLFDHPTAETVAQYLASLSPRPSGATPAAPTADVNAEVDGEMSDFASDYDSEDNEGDGCNSDEDEVYDEDDDDE